MYCCALLPDLIYVFMCLVCPYSRTGIDIHPCTSMMAEKSLSLATTTKSECPLAKRKFNALRAEDVSSVCSDLSRSSSSSSDSCKAIVKKQSCPLKSQDAKDCHSKKASGPLKNQEPKDDVQRYLFPIVSSMFHNVVVYISM